MANITLEFEKPIVELEQKIDEIKEMSSGMDISNELAKLEKKVIELRTQIFSNLTPWEVVQLARHPE